MPSPIGSIIAVVAVFETHIDIKAVATINPNKILFGLFAIFPRVKIHRAILLSSPHFCIAPAIKNPARNKKIIGFA